MYNLNGQSLDLYRWQNRILVIESSSITDLNYKKQIAEFKETVIELTDRKILIYEIVGNKYRKTDYSTKNNDSEWKLKNRSKESSNIDAFKVTLIGLDGGVKVEKNLGKKYFHHKSNRKHERVSDQGHFIFGHICCKI